MSGILQTMLDAILSLFGIAFIGWVFWRSLKRSEDAAKLIFKWIFTAVVMWLYATQAVPSFIKGGMDGLYGLIVGILCSIAMVVTWRHSITELLANPISSLYDGGREPPEPKPLYSTALSKRKFNRPVEAIAAVREQLAKFPNDYEGVTLLATIQAEDMKDLQGAEITLNNFCNSENAPDKQVAAAWTQLADWHLKLAQDPYSARAVFEKIIARFPDTILAMQAAERISHLGGTEKQLLAPHDRQAVFVPEGVKNLGLRESIEDLIPVETDPEKHAAELVKHLEQHPLDIEAREKLAIIYARHYKRLDLAAQELNQLVEQPEQPHKRVAHWLNLLADLQIHGGANYETVFATLSKIVELFPDLPVAEVARSRMSRLKLEIKGQNEKTSNVKLGVYEQNIGLKYGPTYGSTR